MNIFKGHFGFTENDFIWSYWIHLVLGFGSIPISSSSENFDMMQQTSSSLVQGRARAVTLEFHDSTLIWWEQVTERREAKGDPPITTWLEMKDVMWARFVPTYYSRNLFKRLQLLKQGKKSVEEYYKEIEIAMIQDNVTEEEEQTMACFLNGFNHHIKKFVDFQPYTNLVELVHQATKAERQVQEDYKYTYYSSKSYDSSYNQASPAKRNPTSTKPSTSNGDKSSYKKTSTYWSRPPSTIKFKPRASSCTTPPYETDKRSVVGKHGHLWDQGSLAGSAGGMSCCTKSRWPRGSTTEITRAIWPRFRPSWGVKLYSFFGGLMVEEWWWSVVHLPGRGGSGYTRMRVWVSNFPTLSMVATCLLLWIKGSPQWKISIYTLIL